jgi:ribosomal peptide maturation radical SAM protein 1
MTLEGIVEPADLLLVINPLTWEIVPSFGTHILEVRCRNAGIKTGVLYSNLLYSNLLGVGLNKIFSHDYYLLMGERIFAVAAFDVPSLSLGGVMHKFLDPSWVPDHVWKIEGNREDPKIPEPITSFKKWVKEVGLQYLESQTTEWLQDLARQIVDMRFRIVGCSTTLGGLLPAVAMLKYVKKADPEVTTIIGGTLCEGEMAEGILSLNTGIDYIFSGEGEITFPALAKQILGGQFPKEKIIYGKEVSDLDTIPLPDFREYFNQKKKLHQDGSSTEVSLSIPYETSRGCWYGKCTFCGLNGKRNVFRSKSPNKIIKDLKALVERHNINFIVMTDTMMPQQYFETLVPRLAAELSSANIIYEMEADLTMDQVLSLKKAGIIIKTGIESLSSSLLRRIQKPYTVRGNIRLLRYARSAGIKFIWNLLFAFPGDQTNEYEEMIRLFPIIHHLPPPLGIPPIGMIPLLLSRFSKYQKSPEMFGIYNLRSAEVFKDILPVHADINKIAYFFAADFPSQSRENPEVITALWEEYQAWNRAWAPYESTSLDILLPTLHVTRKANDRYVLDDDRGLTNRPSRIEINREQASFLLLNRPLDAVPDTAVRWAVDARLGVTVESWFIPLATADPAMIQEFESEYGHE